MTTPTTSTTTLTSHDLNIPRSENLLPPGTIHDEIEIEDFQFDAETGIFTYPCPCGDIFQISIQELRNGAQRRIDEDNDALEVLAKCPSCSLVLKVIFDAEDFLEEDEEDDDEDEDAE